jgi:hypothetical protein
MTDIQKTPVWPIAEKNQITWLHFFFPYQPLTIVTKLSFRSSGIRTLVGKIDPGRLPRIVSQGATIIMCPAVPQLLAVGISEVLY